MRGERLPHLLGGLTRARVVSVAVVLLLLAGIAVWFALGTSHPAPGGSQGPPPTLVPTPAGPHQPDGVDLAGWKLTLPVEDGGDVTIIDPATTAAPWLTPNPGGGLIFWSPTSGATTKHSSHPRTELDSLTNFSAGHGVHTLTASVTLLQTPQDRRGIILGQIHGADDISSSPYVMLRFQDGVVRVVVKQVQQGAQHINYPLLNDVELNTRFGFSITDSGNGNLIFTATRNGQTYQVVAPIPAEFKDATVRFQAGDYQQANTSAGPQDGGRVIFHQLTQDPNS